MKYDFDKIIDRKGTGCAKWDNLKEVFGREDILPLWVADMDFEVPKEVKEAIVKRAQHGIYGYTYRSQSFYESIISWESKRHGLNIDKGWLTFTPGVVSALSTAVLAFTEPSDSIIIQTPVYPPFYSVIRDNGRKIVENPLKEENGHYYMDFDDLEKKINDKVKMFILCSPHNPVGRVWSKEELNRLCEICIKNNILLVCDEIHSDIVYKGFRHIPIASLNEKVAQNSITCTAPSKTFNVAGLSCSAIIIPNENIRNKFNKQLDAIHIGSSNVFGLTALEACYTYGEEWLNELLIYLEANRDFVLNFIQNEMPEVKVSKPEGTYLMWLDFRKIEKDGKKLNDLMVDKAKVGMNNGINFGSKGEGFMRLNIACPRSLLEEGLNRIKTAIK
ncbi:MAG TPA: cystathionine beta-lyase [Clostridiaceae bacterium]|jgi:cystathionine beta-lyase|nr:cystathionine beta-lyase [Clostridiaceae bacterium]HBF78194.1 cystathionine beta-lyase [Clostridiaceae bacterium]HBG37751.1 cystathionine beta-lyase [Clostridiaceae bacterium]HBN29293.1 cystathionine beta-lyase [Clostridiaceae bacterium]HBX48217.1 cystathionine beta-lyase [Clostridiaceae bacterium]